VLDRRTRAGLVPAWRDALAPATARLLPDLGADTRTEVAA
jgi:hypothetical protein